MNGCGCPRARHTHGTNRNYYAHKCRCFPCRVAHANATQSYRDGGNWREADLMPSVGVRRRLQALAVIGYTATLIAEHSGLSVAYVSKLRTDTEHAAVKAETHRLVAAMYDRLWDKPITTADGRRCTTQVRRLGWVPPLAWDDDEIDDPSSTCWTPAPHESWELRPCGSNAAARRHRRRGEPLDRACLAAESRYRAEQKAKRAA